jgi:hypothetical protein
MLRPHERPGAFDRFEVQVLDDAGRATSVGNVGEGTTELNIAGRAIPLAVIEAAKRCEEGKGDYVGPDGNSLPPF